MNLYESERANPNEGNTTITTSAFDLKPLSKLGFQSTLGFSEKFSFTGQGMLSGDDNDQATLEWAYFSYDIHPDARFRIGRMRRPIFEHSDYINIAFSYVWPQPPRYVYDDFKAIYSSVEALNFFYQGNLGEWSYSSETYFSPYSSGVDYLYSEPANYKSKESIGTVINVENGDFALRLGTHQARMSYEMSIINEVIDGLRQLGYPQYIDAIQIKDRKVQFMSISGSYTAENWKFFGEYINYHAEKTFMGEVKAWYLGAQRSFGDFILNFTFTEYSSQKTNMDFTTPIRNDIVQLTNENTLTSQIVAEQLGVIADGIEEFVAGDHFQMNSYSATLRYDFHPKVSAKLGYDYAHKKQDNFKSTQLMLGINFIY